MKPAAQQLEYLLEGVDTVLPDGGLEARLGEGRPLRVKLGVDPTAPDVHLGWAVVLHLLRRFQDLGHTAVLILGDFTAQVGDPSGKSETRKRLEAGDVAGYASSCLDVMRELLLPDRLEIRRNSEWLGGMDMTRVLELTSKLTVSRLLERDDFAQRYAAGKPISLIEFMYPLLQGLDSVAVEADVELGGADQLWNLLVGRDIQERYGQHPQVVMTVPLLVGTDGTRKMSQSYGNYISVRDEAADMFGKVMSIPDEVMHDYFVLAAGTPAAAAADIGRGLEAGTLHPGDTKRRLGREVVARYHGPESAAAAEAAFDRVFRDKQAPADLPEHDLGPDDPVWIPGLLTQAGLTKSNGEGRRLVAQGAVRIDGEPITTEELARADLGGRVLQVGKRRFLRLLG
jgi:tyrosyl-tRNA synthetase